MNEIDGTVEDKKAAELSTVRTFLSPKAKQKAVTQDQSLARGSEDLGGNAILDDLDDTPDAPAVDVDSAAPCGEEKKEDIGKDLDDDSSGFGTPELPVGRAPQQSKPSVWHDVKRSFAADDCDAAVPVRTFNQDFAIMRSSIHRNSQSSVTLPWESGFFATVMKLGQNIKQADAWMESRSQYVPPLPEIEAPLKRKLFEVQVARPTRMTAKHKMARVTSISSEDELRSRSLRVWKHIIEMDLRMSDVGCQIEALYEENASDRLVTLTLSDTFRGKSTGTLTKRSAAFLHFVSHMQTSKSHELLGFDELTVYRYLCELRAMESAPTKADSFKQCMVFMHHALGIPSALPAMKSKRVAGCCTDQFLRKRKLKQARRLTVKEVEALERATRTAKCLGDRIAAGQFCMCLFSCARFHDSQHPERVTCDVDAAGLGTILMETSKHKTSTSQDKKTKLLPMLALTLGVSAEPWGPAWISARADAGLGPCSDPMLQALSVSGAFQSRAATTGEATLWLRDVLAEMGCDSEDVSTHGLKATLLSWLALYNVAESVRRVVGHHVDPASKSCLTYSRDAMSGPMATIAQMLGDIRTGKFEPDSTRRIKQLLRKNAMTKMPTDDPRESDSDVGCTDSSDSSDSDVSLGEMMNAETEDSILGSMRSSPSRPVTSSLGGILRQHSHTGTIHSEDDLRQGRLLCGRLITPVYALVSLSNLKMSWPDCSACLSKQTSRVSP